MSAGAAPGRREGRLRVAFVVQRYGAEVNGGAEQLCRALARRLARRAEIETLTVLTTCARDHTTWANHYPQGESVEDGVRVVRHRVLWRRSLPIQRRLFEALERHPNAPWLERLWLLAQGPFAPSLLRRIAASREAFDAFVFVTYLYHPTVRGLPLVKGRAILISTAHDEPAITAPIFRRLFAAPRAVACLTPEEREFLRARFGLAGRRLEVLGSGLDDPPDVTTLEAERAVLPQGPYVLYVGRIEAGKGVPELLEGFRELKRRHGGDSFRGADGREHRISELRLVLAGRVEMDLPAGSDVVPAGFVSEAAKHALLRSCELLVSPSLYESLSLVVLEAWQHARPVLVNAGCAVTAGQVARSGGGRTYEGANGLAEALAGALADSAWRAGCGAAGRDWVRVEYAWDAIEARWLSLLREVAA